MKCSKSRRRGAYDAPPDPLVVRGFLPSAIIIVYMYMQPGFPLESKNRTCVRPDIKFWTYQIPSSDQTGRIISRVGLHNHEQYYQQFKIVAYLKIESSSESVYTIEHKCLNLQKTVGLIISVIKSL